MNLPTLKSTEQLLAEVIAAGVEMAFVRHDLRIDEGELSIQQMQEIARDAANAVRGIDTCLKEPCPEWKAIAERAIPPAGIERLREQLTRFRDLARSTKCPLGEERAFAYESVLEIVDRIFGPAEQPRILEHSFEGAATQLKEQHHV